MIGKTILHYEIIEKLGGGGMGVVFRATDTKLNREVALKFLPPTLTSDAETRQRFIQEAQAASALDHNNICTIYEIVETEDGEMFIAMAYYPGETLKKKIESRPLPVNEAIDIATQISQGLAKAHESGIVHRDIKPANIMVSESGEVKIVDFGLAKLTGQTKLTKLGTTIGTAAYMSPEQMRGDKVDHRTDIWSLGVVMYEMLTGQLPFKGDYEQAVSYAILNEEPEPITALRTGIPLALEWVVNKAMAKDPKQRYQHVDEIPVDLEGTDKISTSRAGIAPQSRAQKNAFGSNTRGNPWLMVGILLAGIFLASLWWWKKTPETALPLRKSKFNIDGILETDTGYSHRNAAISPNGEIVAFIQYERLWIRDLKQVQAREIVGTQRVLRIFWSSNSEHIAYLDQEDKKFKKVSLQTGAIKVICDYDYYHPGFAEAWKKDGTIIIGITGRGLFAVSDGGGESQVFAKQDTAKNELGSVSGTLLPDGTFLAVQVHLYSNAAKLIKIDGSTKISIDGIPNRQIDNLVYSPSGHLVFNDSQGLWAVPFSVSQAEITGKLFQIDPNGFAATVSNTNTLVYTRDASPGERLLLVDMKGVVTDTIGQIQNHIHSPAVSPMGDRIAVSGREKGDWDIWIHDGRRGNKELVTVSPSVERGPLWHPGESSLIFTSNRLNDGALFKKQIYGSEEASQIKTGPYWAYEPTLSRAADYLVYVCWTGGMIEAETELWYVPFERSGRPEVFLNVGSSITSPELSPDGKYLAYQSEVSGQSEVYVTNFPGKEFREKVSINGGQGPKWNATGDELFYCNNNTMMAAKVDTDSGGPVIRKPKALFKGSLLKTELIRKFYAEYDVMPDGRHFVVVQPIGKKQSEIIVVQNWFKEFEETE